MGRAEEFPFPIEQKILLLFEGPHQPPVPFANCIGEVFLGRIWNFCTDVRVGADLRTQGWMGMEGLMVAPF